MAIFTRTSDIVPAERMRAIRSLAESYASTVDGRVTYLGANQYFDKLLSELNNIRIGKPFFQAEHFVVAPWQKISSEQWNTAQERIYTDLRAIYAALNRTLAEEAYRGASIREKFKKTRAQILRIVNEIRLYGFLRNNPDYQDAKFINFSDAINEATARPTAEIDARSRLLELPPRQQFHQAQAHKDLHSTQVTVEHLGGGVRGGLTREFEPEKMLDVREDTFWAEMIMAKGPISQKYVGSGDGGLGGSFESSGAIAHVTLTFDQVVLANTVQILPFGEFPVRVIDVAYKETDSQTDWIMIPNFMVEDATVDWIEVNFQPTPMAKLRITIEQENYRANVYYLPEDMVRNNVLWQQIGATRQEQVLHELELTQDDEDLLEIEPEHLARLEAEKDFKDALDHEPLSKGREQQFHVASSQYKAAVMALSKVKPGLANDLLLEIRGEAQSSASKTVGVPTYEYVYGIREVQLKYSIYEPLAHFDSKKFRTMASILEVTLTTEERHMDVNDGTGDYQVTSTEWEVEVGRDRRFAIAPQNWVDNGHVVVKSEYLSVDRQTRSGTTRFPVADFVISLRENGAPVPADSYTVNGWTPSSGSGPFMGPGDSITPGFRSPGAPSGLVDLSTRGQVVISESQYDPNAVYTLFYNALSSSALLDIDGELNSVGSAEPEAFVKTNRNNQIALRTVPFINYDIIHSDVWTLDGNARWKYVPTQSNVHMSVDLITGVLNPRVSSVNGGAVDLATQIDWTQSNSLKPVGSSNVYPVTGYSGTRLILSTPLLEGVPGVPNEVDVGGYFETDGRAFGFEQSLYEPIQVYVNNVKATNFTNYETLQHQAFSEAPRRGKQIQFIQAGSIIYFNQPIEESRIEVYYSWLTEYVKLNCTLRCNQPVHTVLTPQVNSARVELKTSPL